MRLTPHRPVDTKGGNMKKLVMMLTLLLATNMAVAGEWEVCINGTNLQGQPCQGDTWNNWNKPRQIMAHGHEAIELIRNGNILASDIDTSGQYRLIVTYQGQYRPAQGKTFSCTVSPDARQFECRSWTPIYQ